MSRIQSVALCLVCVMIGLGFLSTGLSGSDLPLGGVIASVVLGIFMLFAAVIFFLALVLPAFRDKSGSVKEELTDLVRTDQTGAADGDETDGLLTAFREALRAYFAARGLPENSPLQSAATQVYWHILYLQKRRMENKGITLDFSAQRKSYGGVSVTKEQYTDGKYDITDARERIAATRVYAREGKPLWKKHDDELAHYTILHARPVLDGNSILCPNCGNTTTRENLLDGCDYCGTRFTVEDLGSRVSGFALRQDYQIAYDKYRDQRRYYGNRAFLAGAIPVAVLSLIGFLSVAGEMDSDPVMGLVATFFGTLFLAGSAGLFARYGFWVTLFPVIQARKSLVYYTKKRLEERKASQSRTEVVAEKVHRFDPLFSLEGFFSSVQNKLAAIHYAQRPQEAKPFVGFPLESVLNRYGDVVDMDVAEISLLDYQTDGRVQLMELRTLLVLTEAHGDRFSQRTESLRLTLEKSGKCKTEAVCAPSVLTCKGCGASLSLLDGGRCAYCGRELDLRQYDWVIAEYEVE